MCVFEAKKGVFDKRKLIWPFVQLQVILKCLVKLSELIPDNNNLKVDDGLKSLPIFTEKQLGNTTENRRSKIQNMF